MSERTAIIYMIRGPLPEHRYVGCTGQSINERFIKHKSRAKMDESRNSKLCKAMREHGVEALRTVPYAVRAQEEAISITVRGVIGPNGLNQRLPKYRYLSVVPPPPPLPALPPPDALPGHVHDMPGSPLASGACDQDATVCSRPSNARH